MTDQKQPESPEVKPKVSPEVEVKNTTTEDRENPEDPMVEVGEVSKSGEASAD